MKNYKLLVLIFYLGINYSLYSQELPGLSYCLLFETSLEKAAFQKSNSMESDPLLFLLAYDVKADSSQYSKIRNELLMYSDKLNTKRGKFKSEDKFLRYVFNDVHTQYLKKYRSEETFNNIFSQGSYNCITGAALYGYVLERLGFVPKIYKTRYHIFLLVNLSDSETILFETTDAVNGFVDNKTGALERIDNYLKKEREQLSRQETLSAPFNDRITMELISLKELTGLHYYNLGVELLNKNDYYEAFRVLKKASILYPTSDCIKDFIAFAQIQYELELTTAFKKK